MGNFGNFLTINYAPTATNAHPNLTPRKVKTKKQPF